LQGEAGQFFLTKPEFRSKDGLEVEVAKVNICVRRRENARLDNLSWTACAGYGAAAYAESKFLDVPIAIAAAIPDRRLA
jgi:hypothetical protein